MERGPGSGHPGVLTLAPAEPAAAGAVVAVPARGDWPGVRAVPAVRPRPAAPPSLPAASEAELVARARGGDRAALGQIYRDHYAPVRRHAYHLLGPDPDLDDVVQDVFVSAFGSLRGFRGEAALATWLHRVTVRVARRHGLRRTLRRALAALAPPPVVLGAPDDEERERARALHAALARLGRRLREAFVLRYLEGLSVEDAARVAGVRPDAVKQRAGRAVRRLKEILRDERPSARPAREGHEDVGDEGHPR